MLQQRSLKIPRVTEEAIISAFSDGVCHVKMKEELAIHEDLCTSLELFNLATKCARAEEGRLVGERCRKQKISYGFTKIHL